MGAIFFVLLAAVTLLAGWSVVHGRDLVRSVFWLAGLSLAVAGIYASLDAGFLAAVQVLLYTGGVVTLLLFGVMLTLRRGEGPGQGATLPVESRNPLFAAAVAGIVFALLATGILGTALPSEPVSPMPGAAELGEAVLVRWPLALEALSVLLLAAMIGAIVLARRRDPR